MLGVADWAWLATGAYLALYVSWQAWRWIPASQELVGDLFFLPISAATVLAAWRASARARSAPRVRFAWRLVAAAMVAYVFANSTQLVYEVVLNRKPYPSLADVGFLAFYPLMLAALSRFPAAREDSSARGGRLVDFALTAVAGTMTVWYIVLGPVAISGGQALTLAVSVAYPVGDLILIVGLASLLLRGTLEESRDALRLMGVGLALFVAADLTYGYITLHGVYHGGDRVDVLWMLAQALLFLATCAQRTIASNAAPVRRRRRQRTNWLPYAAIAVALALLALAQGSDPWYPDMSIVAATILLACLLAGRQLLTDRAQRRGRREIETIASLERLALQGGPEDRLQQSAIDAVAAHLDCELGAVMRCEPGGKQIRMAAAHGWPGSTVGNLSLPVQARSQAGATIASETPIVIEDLRSDARFPDAVLLREQNIRSSVSVRISGREGATGAIGVHTRRRRRFSEEEISFLETVAAVLSAAVERRQAEEEIRHRAVHDGLTELPNRLLFEDRLSYALRAIGRHDRQLAVLFVDLDNFKHINDSLGHRAGDELLRLAAIRLADTLRPEDTLARMGGDEFAIVLPEIGEAHDAVAAGERLLTSLRAPFATSQGHKLMVTASIGIAIATPASAVSPDDLLRNADLAMYAAKQAGKGQLRFYTDSMHENAMLRLQLAGDLRSALQNGELSVRYQPIMTLADDAVVGAEALARWTHPERGEIPPNIFIELAEESGLIDAVGELVIRQACAEAQRWRAQPGGEALSIAVNVSAQQLRSSRLLADIQRALADSGLPADRLIIEITESVLVDRARHVAERLTELKRLGVRLAVDDFGTGYSSLSYLQQFPVDILKIDKSFVDGLGTSVDNDQLVGGIISLAHRIHLQTVAEGIELSGQADALRTMGSELGQGFHYAKPLTATEFGALLGAPSTPGARAGPQSRTATGSG